MLCIKSYNFLLNFDLRNFCDKYFRGKMHVPIIGVWRGNLTLGLMELYSIWNQFIVNETNPRSVEFFCTTGYCLCASKTCTLG